MADPDPNAATEHKDSAPPGIPVPMLWWIFAGVFLVLAGMALFVYYRVPMNGAPPEAMLIPVGLFGVIGLVCVVLAVSGVGSGTVIPMQNLPDGSSTANEPVQAKRSEVKEALAWLEANIRRSPSGPPLPHFHMGYTSPFGPRIFQVYPVDEVFVFLSLYTNAVDARPPTPANPATGLAGGVIAGANAYMYALNREELEERLKVLGRIRDKQVLRDFVERDPESFILEMAGTTDIRVDPPTMWEKTNQAGGMVAKVTLVHPDRGSMSFHIPAFADLTKVAEEFPRRFGEAVRIAPWNAFC